MKRFPVLALVIALGACSSGARPDAGAHFAMARVVAAPTIPDSAPPVRDQVGLASEAGRLAMWCVGSRCDHQAGVHPGRFLVADPTGLVVFATGSPPSAARVESDGLEVPIVPGTTMAATLALSAGDHVVKLIESWPGREAQWLFGVRVSS